MSHYLLSCRMLEDGDNEPVLIFEDDALFSTTFLHNLKHVVDECIEHEVDICWLGGVSRSKDRSIHKYIKIGSKVLGAYAYIVFPKYIAAYNDMLSARPTNLKNRHHYHGDIKMIHANKRTVQAKPRRWMVGCIENISTISERDRNIRPVDEWDCLKDPRPKSKG